MKNLILFISFLLMSLSNFNLSQNLNQYFYSDFSDYPGCGNIETSCTSGNNHNGPNNINLVSIDEWIFEGKIFEAGKAIKFGSTTDTINGKASVFILNNINKNITASFKVKGWILTEKRKLYFLINDILVDTIVFDSIRTSSSFQQILKSYNTSIYGDTLKISFESENKKYHRLFLTDVFVGNDEFLPVTLTDFSVICKDEEVIVKWTTMSENNSDYFIVQRSRNVYDWETIKQVNATGNSKSKIEYEMVDKHAPGQAYYKLVQFDINGDYEEFGPISSSCFTEKDNMMNIYPNPVSDKFTLEIISNKSENTIIYLNDSVSLSDIYGKILENKEVDILNGTNQFIFDITNYNNGIYFINVNNKTIKIVKQ